MKINKKSIIDALDAVRPGLSNKEIIEQSTSFAFMDDHVVTYNDEIAIRFPLAIDIEGAIRADELYKLLSKTKDTEIELEISDNELNIKGKKTKAGISLVDEIKLPLEELGDFIDEWTKLPKTFIPALKKAIPFAASDMSKPVLTCINIMGRYVDASDDYRIIRIDLGKRVRVFKEALQIPQTAAKILIQYQVTEFHKTEGWCHFKADNGLIFSARVMAEEFPDITPYLDVDGVELKLPDNTKEILERAGIFSGGDSAIDEEVQITIKDRRIIFRGSGDYGWLEEEANIRYKGEKIEFVVSPAFLYDILDELQHCIVGENSMKFQGDDFEHVVSLVG